MICVLMFPLSIYGLGTEKILATTLENCDLLYYELRFYDLQSPHARACLHIQVLLLLLLPASVSIFRAFQHQIEFVITGLATTTVWILLVSSPSPFK